jgi:hypothetical protein
MKFKTVVIVSFFTLLAFGAKAQTSDAEAEAIVNLLGVQKREIIAKLVPVSGKDSVAFWKLYSAYENDNKKIAMSRIGLYQKTAQAYSNMTPAVADSLAKKYFTNRFNQEKSLEEYYNKIKDATNAIVAFEFYQSEVYLLTQLRASIMQQIPSYSELKLMARNNK